MKYAPLRSRLARAFRPLDVVPEDVPPNLAELLDLLPTPVLRPAAVLVPIRLAENGASVVLTRRTDDLPTHPGQISFPGGRIEESDRDPVAAALRETHEEIGIAPCGCGEAFGIDDEKCEIAFRITTDRLDGSFLAAM